jgi:hypothetical protein
MWVTVFIKTSITIKRYKKIYSCPTLFLLLTMNIAFLSRAVICQISFNKYGSAEIKYLKECYTNEDPQGVKIKYVAFQGMMQINSVINWFLNIIFDVVVLKMISIYKVFNAKNREMATLITKRTSR